MLLSGNFLIAWLKSKRWKKGASADETWAVREDTPDTHLKKQGTPSMGGIGIVACTLLPLIAIGMFFIGLFTALAGDFSLTKSVNLLPVIIGKTLLRSEVFSIVLLPVILFSHACLGFADDWSKASGRGGLRARAKLATQIVLAVGFVLVLVLLTNLQRTFVFSLSPFALNGLSDGGLLLLGMGFLAIVIVAMGNAVNLTDGIDGLAAGLAVQCAFSFFLIGSISSGQPYILFWSALSGACLGFLNFNKHKARVFMGDTGSLAIGAALGAGAILQHAVFLLPFIGFIYFVEMFSVIAQVAWFKYTKKKTGEGKRLLLRAPLHHHFELAGWSEWRVVLTFWGVNLCTSAIGLWLWHAGVLPQWP